MPLTKESVMADDSSRDTSCFADADDGLEAPVAAGVAAAKRTNESTEPEEGEEEYAVLSRRQHPVWKYILCEKVQGPDGPKFQQKCHFCQLQKTSSQRQTTNWTLHLMRKCPKAPEAVQLELLAESRVHTVKQLVARAHLPGAAAPAAASRASATPATTPAKGVLQVLQHATGPGPGQYTRPASAVWEFVNCEKTQDGRYKQSCKYCDFCKISAQKQTTNMAVHVIACPAAPEAVRKVLCHASRSEVLHQVAVSEGVVQATEIPVAFKKKKSTGDATGAAATGTTTPSNKKRLYETTTTSPAAAAAAAAKKPRLSQGHHANHIESANNKKKHVPVRVKTHTAPNCKDMCSPARAQEISMAVLRFLTGTAQSLTLAESPLFLDLLRSMNDTYVVRYLPKALIFRITWLDRLVESLETQLLEHWYGHADEVRKQPLLSVGCSKLDSSGGGTMCMLTEMHGRQVALLDIAPLSELQQEQEQVGNDNNVEVESGDEEEAKEQGEKQQRPEKTLILVDRLIQRAGKTKVDDHFAAVVTATTSGTTASDDNGGGRLQHACREIQERFPRIFVNACAMTACREIAKAIGAIPEIRDIVDDCKAILSFLHTNASVKAAFRRIMQGREGPTFPKDPTVAGDGVDNPMIAMDALLGSVLGPESRNVQVWEELVQEDAWKTDTTVGVPSTLVRKMEELLKGGEMGFLFKVEMLRMLTTILAAFSRHLQTPPRASWIYPLFEALCNDVDDWCNDHVVSVAFLRQGTFGQVKKAVERPWRGQGSVHNDDDDEGGLYSPQYLLAYMMDPTIAPDQDKLPKGWDDEIDSLFKRFYTEGDEFMAADEELLSLVDHQGKFGSEVNKFRISLATVMAVPSPADELGRSRVEHVVALQKAALRTSPDLIWKTKLRPRFPLLHELARRVLVMSAVSESPATHAIQQVRQADFTKRNVVKLAYCYVNLRLLKRSDPSSLDEKDVLERFLNQAILSVDDNDDLEEEEDTKAPAVAVLPCNDGVATAAVL